MPKSKIDYSITPVSFYRFCCKDLNITSCYVGHTFNFVKRRSQHKTCCNNPKNKVYNLKIYQTIREHGGWGNWQMIEIENKICLSKRDAERHEQTLTEQLAADLNMINAFGVKNRSEYQKQYRDDHIEEKKLYSKQRYIDNREELNKPTECACGCIITKHHLTRHKKSKKHISLMCVNT